MLLGHFRGQGTALDSSDIISVVFKMLADPLVSDQMGDAEGNKYAFIRMLMRVEKDLKRAAYWYAKVAERWGGIDKEVVEALARVKALSKKFRLTTYLKQLHLTKSQRRLERSSNSPLLKNQ